MPERRRLNTEPDGREYRDLLLRLIDGIKADIGALRDGHGDLDKIARDAYNRLGEMERRVNEVERVANAATISLVEIRALAKGAGSVAGTIGGAITGILASILVAFILQVLHIGK